MEKNGAKSLIKLIKKWIITFGQNPCRMYAKGTKLLISIHLLPKKSKSKDFWLKFRYLLLREQIKDTVIAVASHTHRRIKRDGFQSINKNNVWLCDGKYHIIK